MPPTNPEIASTKSQTISKSQSPNPNRPAAGLRSLGFGAWKLFVIWCLEFGGLLLNASNKPRNRKHQITNNLKIPKSKSQTPRGRASVVGVWCLEIVCDLVLGIWRFTVKCLQQTPKSQAPNHKQSQNPKVQIPNAPRPGFGRWGLVLGNCL